MEDLLYYDVHKANVRNSTISGFTLPRSTDAGLKFKLYCIFIDWLLVVCFIFMAVQISHGRLVPAILPDVVSTYLMMYGVVGTVYYRYYFESFQRIFKAFNEITKECVEFPPIRGPNFRERILLENQLMYKCVSYIPATLLISAFTFYMPFVLRILLFGIRDEADERITDESTAGRLKEAGRHFLCMLGAQFGGSRKATVEWFLASLMTLSLTHLNHLEAIAGDTVCGSSAINLPENYQSTMEQNEVLTVDNKVKKWVMIHQKILKLNSDISQTVNPLLIFYFTTIVLTCGVVTCVVIMSRQVSADLFWNSYKSEEFLSRSILSNLKIILSRTHTPITFAAYKSDKINLMNETFVSCGFSIFSLISTIRKFNTSKL
ncbi:uncharacterized protein LOC111056321 isoform X2 [Nilaparvata lugens]|uniref:uncharacterized protein LOC111056321 isoform X2 n=1 Tax=Nilaparvata lugens TaxID=108931 RepID=UPI00193E0F91|nr:uncharacterized protein LOC111056321 isoform X2 [Nilaparvata lugens]